VVLRLILAKSTQPRLRKDRAYYRLKLHAETLVRDIRSRVVPAEDGSGRKRTSEMVYRRRGQREAELSTTETRNTSRAFPSSLLEIILDCLKQLGSLPNDS